MEILVTVGVLVFTLGLTALTIWFFWRIATRAGYSGWWSLTMLIPIVNVIVVWLFAFAEWPALAHQGGVMTDPLPRDEDETAEAGYEPAAGQNYTVTGGAGTIEGDGAGGYAPDELDPEGSAGTIVDRRPRDADGEEISQTAGKGPRKSDDSLGWMLSGFDADGHAVRLRFSVVDFYDKGGLLLGRDPEQCELVVNDSSISRQHARFTQHEGKLHVEDLNSSNGTMIDGEFLEAGDAILLESGTEIIVGETRLRLTNA